jgi:hypothetical protein
MHRVSRSGLVLCAIALLLAACSGSGGSAGTSAPVPRGIGGPGAHQKHHHKGGGRRGGHGKHVKHHRHRGGATSSGTPSSHPGSSNIPAPGRTSQRPGPTSSAPQPHPSTSATHRPPAQGPRVTVTPHTGLSGTQTVTVEGWGFSPNTTLAIAECHDRGTQTGLPDCNINNVITYSPGKKVNSDANGHVGPLQIVVAKTFKSVNCGTVKCLVAVSEPRLDPNPADEGDQYINFA